MNYLEKLIAVKITNPNTILVTSKDVKDQILKYRLEHQIIDNLKLMTEREFEEMFCFCSNPELLNYLINNNPWGEACLKVDIAKQLERAVYTIGYLDIESHPLYSYTQNLIEIELLSIQRKLPKYQFVFHVPRISDLICAVVPVEYQLAKKGQYQITEYNYYLDEIEDAIEQITALVANGTSLEQIHLFAPNNYHQLIKQVAELYKLPVKMQNDMPLLSHSDGRKIYNQLLTNQPIELAEIEPLLIEPIVTIINKYAKYDNQLYWQQIEADLKHAKITLNKSSGLEVKSKIDSKFTSDNFENDHFFILGNYQDGLVSYNLDTNIISDKYRTNLFTTKQHNEIEDSLLYNILNSGKNVHASYATKLLDAHVSLANNLSDCLLIHKTPLLKSEYSYDSDKIRHARGNYVKETFNVKTPPYQNLDNYFQVQYRDNKFTPISKSYEHLKLSYTSINDYYKCPYKFYLGHILRIKNGRFDNHKVVIGNIVHYVLENIDKIENLTSANIRAIIDNYMSEQSLPITVIDNLYFDKFSVYLEAVCVYMKEEEKNSGFNQIDREMSFEMSLLSNVSLVGKIDKILSKIENDNLFVEIYDYKTGALNVDISGIEYGLNMQNLIYFLLLKDYYKHEDGDEVLSGTYQHQIKQKVLYDEEELLDTMKVKGYSQLKHENVFKRSEKILANDEFEQLAEEVQTKVYDAANAINQNQFTIEPKIIKGKNESCSYCPYSSICNKSITDYKFIN